MVVTDQPLIASGLQSLFRDHPEFSLAGVFPSGLDLAQQMPQNHCDVILCGLSPSENLCDVAELLHAAPESRVALLSYDFSNEAVHQARELGVLGFLSTTSNPPAMEECLRTCAGGETWMERALATRLLHTRTIALSKRQSQLIALLVQGLKNKEVAEVLGISEGTVKAYLTTLFEKVGAKDRFELALFGLKNLKNVSREPLSPGLCRETALRSLVA